MGRRHSIPDRIDEAENGLRELDGARVHLGEARDRLLIVSSQVTARGVSRTRQHHPREHPSGAPS